MVPRALLDVFRSIASEHQVSALLQMTIDSATKFTGAEFGAFFYSEPGSNKAYTLYVLSGASRDDFSMFPPVRSTPMFAPTFEHQQAVRVDDIFADPRYGQNAPHSGLPDGHLPVRSYLAVPVVARAGQTYGALIFGHKLMGQFTDASEHIATAIAAHAAVALDNARLRTENEEAIRHRDDFLSIAAHEIRTPLTPLKLRLQMLERQVEISCQDKPELIKSIAVCTRQVNRLTILVEELLDVARIRTGKLTLNFSRFDIVELVEDIAERYQPQADASGGSIEVIAEDQPIIGRWDYGRLSQVIVNLVSNALQYAPGTPITVDVHQHGDEIIISVSDKGPGIPNEDHQRIFDRFDRSNASVKRGGLGLGLYIGRKIVEAHDGVITVDSEIGHGTRFAVFLPLEPEGIHTDEKEVDFGC